MVKQREWKWPKPIKLDPDPSLRHYSRYKPFTYETLGFSAISYGNVWVLQLDSAGAHFEATFVFEDIDLLIRLLRQQKKLMQWQRRHKLTGTQNDQLLKKHRETL